MTLTERMRDECAVLDCSYERIEGSLFCGANGRGHLADQYAGRLVRTPEGYVNRDALVPRGTVCEPAWRTWTREHQNAKAVA